MNSSYNIYIVGLGGQGVLTIGDLISHAVQKKGLKINFFPTKGMSQRGGFVQVQIRIGESVGPAISPKNADLVVSMERSEGLKAKRFTKPDADFLFFDDSWLTSAVVLNKASYPTTEAVVSELKDCCGNFIYVDNSLMKGNDNKSARTNMFILGALIKNTGLKKIISLDDVIASVKEMWPNGVETNIESIMSGYSTNIKSEEK